MEIQRIKRTIALLAALAFCAAPAGRAADDDKNRSSRQDKHDKSAKHQHKSAKELTGKKIKGAGGDQLGQVKDFVIDTQSGKAVFAVVSGDSDRSTFSSGSSSQRVVPVKVFRTAGTDTQEFTVSVDKSKWEQAPIFRSNDLASLASRAQEIFQTFGQTYDAPSSQAWSSSSQTSTTGTSSSQSTSNLVLASSLKGQTVRSANEEIGRVEDVVINLADQSALLLIDTKGSRIASAGTPTATTSTQFAVPFAKLNISTTGGTRSTITTTLARTDFERAQPITESASTSSSATSQVYRWTTADASTSTSSGADTSTGSTSAQSSTSGTSTASTQPSTSGTSSSDPSIASTSGNTTSSTPSSTASQSGATTSPTTTDTTIAGTSGSSGATITQPSTSTSGQTSIDTTKSGTTSTTSDTTMASVNPNPPVSAVQQALRSDPTLAEEASKVTVTAERGRIVLRGSVSTGNIRKQIVDKAEQAATGYSVDNELSVRGWRKGQDKDKDSSNQ